MHCESKSYKRTQPVKYLYRYLITPSTKLVKNQTKIKKAAHLLPGLSPNVEGHYGGDNTISFVDCERGVHNVNVAEGGNTGCAKLPFLFTVAVQEVLKDVRARHPRVRILGQVDDHNLLGVLQDCIAAYSDMIDVFKAKLGLSMNQTKLKAVGGSQFEPSAQDLAALAGIGAEIVPGIKLSGAPFGSDEYVSQFLEERLGRLDAIAVLLESAVLDRKLSTRVSWQSLLSLVQKCVATRFHFLTRVLLPSQMESFAAKVDDRLVVLALRVSGHWLAASEDLTLLGDPTLRNRTVLLPTAWGGLGVPRMPVLAGFIGAAALIGPAITGLVPETNFNADTRYRRELAAALESVRDAINAPPPYAPPGVAHADDGDDEPPDPPPDQPPDPGIRRVGKPVDSAVLKKLSIDSIHTSSIRKVQGAVSKKLAAVEAAAVHAALLQKLSPCSTAAAARFVDRWQRGASAWLHASRKDPRQRFKNAEFRIAVGTLLGLKCFKEVPASTPCPHCHAAIGEDLIEHALRCKAAYTGDNNRRHQAMQQILLYLLRLGGATVVATPGVVSFTGADAKDASHDGRQLDLGIRGLDNGDDIALDLCVSDSGTGKVSVNYKTGNKCEAKSKAKKAKYLARFNNIKSGELCIPGYGRSGSRSKDAVDLQKRITKAIAAANPTVPYSVTAARVGQLISVALQKAVAYNALDFRWTKLPKARVVGGGAVELLAQAVAAGGDDWDVDDDEQA
jgi:hypothetical protein